MLLQVRTILDVGHRWLQSINLRNPVIQKSGGLAHGNGAGGREGEGNQNSAAPAALELRPTGHMVNTRDAPPKTAVSLSGHAAPFLPRQPAEQRSTSPATPERRHPSGTTADSSLLQGIHHMTLNDREPQHAQQSAVVTHGDASPHLAPLQPAVTPMTADAQASPVEPTTIESHAPTAATVALSPENAQIEQLLEFILQNPERREKVNALLAGSAGQPNAIHAKTPVANEVGGQTAVDAMKTPLLAQALAPATKRNSEQAAAPAPSPVRADVATEDVQVSGRRQTNVTASELHNATSPACGRPLQENRPPTRSRNAATSAVDAEKYYRGRNVKW
jgi:hypothetical protein